MPCKAAEIVENLTHIDEDVRLSSVRCIKNAVIGNKTKKVTFMQLGAIPKLVEILDKDSTPELLIQAAAALGSFACGTEQNVYDIVNHNGVTSLIKRLSYGNPKVVEACARSMKILFQSNIPPRSRIFQGGGTIKLLIKLLQSTDSSAESAATILARCCQGPECQNEIMQHGGVEALVKLLDSKTPKSIEASLDALSSLSFSNSELSNKIIRVRPQIPSQLLVFIKDKRSIIRLLSCKCLANLSRSNAIASKSQEMMLQVLPTLVKLCDDPEVYIKISAPAALAHLIEESEELQKAACEADAVNKLTSYFSVENIQSENIVRLRRSALTALAALCSKREESRKLVIEAKALPHVIASLEHSDVSVREAACQCTRSLSRSVKTLRTSLVDAGAALPLFKLLSDSSIRVQSAASATLCNIVLDFSPMKKIVMEQGAVPRLVSLSQSMDYTLRLNSVWALKNLLFQADSTVKEHVMSELGYENLLNLLSDSEANIQEQALTLLRNLAYGGEEDIEKVISGAGNNLIHILENVLVQRKHQKCVIQALFVVCNIATGGEKHKTLIMNNECIINAIVDGMSDEDPAARVAALWCIINLTWTDDYDFESRIEKLRAKGVEAKLKMMIDDSDLDVKDRVKTALDQFSKHS